MLDMIIKSMDYSEKSYCSTQLSVAGIGEGSQKEVHFALKG
jgi:hypothetical protein